MDSYKELKDSISQIEKQLQISFKDKEVLLLSFIHRSFFNENKNLLKNYNERLEFLGDAVLNLIVSHLLYEKLPQIQEGELSHLKSCLIDAASCAGFIKKLKLENFLLLGKGEKMTLDRGRDTILSDCFEAIIGAVYLDKGFLETKNFFINHFEHELLQIINTPQINYKAALQDFSQRTFQMQPQYNVIEETGLDHLKTFKVAVLINNQEMGIGLGSSKKVAEQKAAEDAMKKIIK
ncbi:MAG: ribonuclease III [Chlamydiae bacterium]|nr:ribonuclease III [Chlamydiota bacterium]